MDNSVKNVFCEQVHFDWTFDNKNIETKEDFEDKSDDEAIEASSGDFVEKESPVKFQLVLDESKDEKNDRAEEALTGNDDFGSDNEADKVEEEISSNRFNPKLERVLDGVKRILRKIRKSVQKDDKYNVDQTSKDLQYAYNKLDRAYVEMNGSREQGEEIESLFEELGKITDKNIAMKVAIDEQEQFRSQLPEPSLMTWNGDDATFHDFRMHMSSVLRYNDEALNLSSLKAQITDGKEKQKILRRIENCRTVSEAFQTLQKFYGDIGILQSKLKARLDDLAEYPENRDLENNNVEKILNYMGKMRKFNLETKYINRDFIHRFMHKLSFERCQELIDKDISSSKEFESFLNKILNSNQKIILTKPTRK